MYQHIYDQFINQPILGVTAWHKFASSLVLGKATNLAYHGYRFDKRSVFISFKCRSQDPYFHQEYAIKK